MSKQYRHHRHNRGFNVSGVEAALQVGDIAGLNLALHIGRGSMASRRNRARGLVSAMLRSGGDLPVPDIDYDSGSRSVLNISIERDADIQNFESNEDSTHSFVLDSLRYVRAYDGGFDTVKTATLTQNEIRVELPA